MNFTADTVGKMKDLEIQNYKLEVLEQFLNAHPLKMLLETLYSTDDITSEKNFVPRRTIQKILSKPDIFQTLVKVKDHSDIIEKFSLHPNEHHREFAAQLLEYNVDNSIEILEKFADDVEHNQIKQYIQWIFYLLKDPEFEVGLKVSKFLVAIAKTIKSSDKIDFLFGSPLSVKLISENLQWDNAVVEMRTLETIIKTGNEWERLYDLYEKNGLVKLGLELYKKYFDDILEKMNLVEIMATMGMTETGCNLLANHPIFSVIKKEALAKDTDPFIAKSLGVLLIDLVNYGKINYSFPLFKDLRTKLEENMMTGFGEELLSWFEMIRSFGKSFEGYTLIYKNKNILEKLLVCWNSHSDLEEKKALHAFLGLLHPRKTILSGDKKGQTIDLDKINIDECQIELIIIYLSKPKFIHSILDIGDEIFLKDAVNYIVDKLLSPFEETEFCFIRLLLNVMNINRVLTAFCKNARCLEYLHMKGTKTKEMFDAKCELKENIQKRVYDLHIEKKDEFYHMFLTQYKIKQEQRKMEMMEYATEAAE